MMKIVIFIVIDLRGTSSCIIKVQWTNVHSMDLVSILLDLEKCQD